MTTKVIVPENKLAGPSGVSERVMNPQAALELPERMTPEDELAESHAIMDALMAGTPQMALPDRLRDLVAQGAGEIASRRLNLHLGRALARAWRDKQGHAETCPCSPCREAKALL